MGSNAIKMGTYKNAGKYGHVLKACQDCQRIRIGTCKRCTKFKCEEHLEGEICTRCEQELNNNN